MQKTTEVLEHVERLTKRFPQLAQCREQILASYELLRACYDAGGMLLVCGNGGSGADAEHIVGELMKEFAVRRPLPTQDQLLLRTLSRELSEQDGELLAAHLQGALPAVTLTSNIALSTAYANDALPELVFAQQVYGYGQAGSALLGISTSGDSKNVIYALMTAKLKGMKTIGLTGERGEKMKEMCDACICVPASFTPDVQELHLPVYHCLCRMLEEAYFG